MALDLYVAKRHLSTAKKQSSRRDPGSVFAAVHQLGMVDAYLQSAIDEQNGRVSDDIYALLKEAEEVSDVLWDTFQNMTREDED